MKQHTKRRVGQAVMAGALMFGALTWTAGSAHAWDGVGVTLTGPHNVGLYITPYLNDKDPYVPDLHPGDFVSVTCWTVGDNINNQGDVWYHVDHEYYWASGKPVRF